jgi:toxin ParE1/3/4
MIPLRVHPEAQDEINAITDYYDGLPTGLGNAFLGELADGFDQIQTLPYAWAIWRDDIRRHQLSRFPYSIVYHADADEILVIAVMHQRRQPDYWMGRTGD